VEKIMNGKKEIAVYHRCLVITGIALIVMIAFSGTSFAKTNIDRTITIDMNKFFDVPMAEVKAGDILDVELQVTSGSAIDALLMKPSDYADYPNAITQRGTINYIANGSSKGVTSKKYTYTFTEAGDYHLVIDNTDVPKGGASPMDQVEMNLKVMVSTPSTPISTPSVSVAAPSESVAAPSSTQPQKTSGFEAILAAFGIVMLALRKK